MCVTPYASHSKREDSGPTDAPIDTDGGLLRPLRALFLTLVIASGVSLALELMSPSITGQLVFQH